MPVEINSNDLELEGPLSEEQLASINARLSLLSPRDILEWGVKHLPNLYQTTAFGLTGLAGIDMLSDITQSPPPLIFLDTLYHFPETLELVDKVRKRYGIEVAVYKPDGCETVEDFERKYGENLWENNEEIYDWVVKVCRLCRYPPPPNPPTSPNAAGSVCIDDWHLPRSSRLPALIENWE